MKNKFIYVTFLTILTFNSYGGGFTNGLNLILDEKLFAFAAGGTSKLDVDASLALNTVLTDGALDKSGALLEIGVGYNHSKKIFTTIALQGNKLDRANIYNIYSSVNYYLLTKNNIRPFIGALAGYSRLRWSKPPHKVSLNKKLSSNSFMYGLQIGAEKELKNNMSVFMKYQFIKHNHRIEIIDNTSNIEHNSSQNLLLGIQYLF